ncbi:MAG: hypothetical protein WCV72_02955 [Patescibacteria group bacterium]
MKNFVRFGFGLITLGALVLFSGCQKNSVAPNETVPLLSNVVQLGVNADSFFVLSETFAQRLKAFSLEFGEFGTTPKFLDRIVAPADSARLVIDLAGQPFLMVFEARLSAQFTFDDIRTALAELDLQPAVFGADSFYFLEQNRATNLLQVKNSALAFELDSQNFPVARDFIASFLSLP